VIPGNVIANADDFGLNSAVNKAILYSYEQGYINSTSLMVNCEGFEEAVEMTKHNEIIKNVGIHINLAEGKPVTNFKNRSFLTTSGDWDIRKTGKKIKFLDAQTKKAFFDEIEAQINKVLEAKVPVTHMDAHLHLHVLPGFYELFIVLAKKYQLKIRLAQSFNEGNFMKFFFRRLLNQKIKDAGCNYSDLFQTVDHFIANHNSLTPFQRAEVMLHPYFDESGTLTDHYLPTDMSNWLSFLKALK
jgi:predicted glycoside hydrolase/deacetylase ChbG (UPF0249 family)